jgi:hypothetical protein
VTNAVLTSRSRSSFVRTRMTSFSNDGTP